MVERLLPADDPVLENVLKWTVERDAKDVRRLLEWLPEARSSRERKALLQRCLLYTSPSPRDATLSRMPSSA